MAEILRLWARSFIHSQVLMPSRYYKKFLPVLVLATVVLCIGFEYETFHEPLPITGVTTVTATTTPIVASTSPALSSQHITASSSKTPIVALVPVGYIQTTISVSGLNYAITVPPRSTVEDAMKLAAAQNPAFTFTEKSFPSLGEFIESINGKANAAGYYWFLYVNGKSSDTGISQTILQPGDEIQWQYKHQ